jgi:hypothetical protein
MSFNLFWRELPVMPQEHSLSKELKFAISHKYWDHDGSLSGNPIIINADDILYFKGLKDAGMADAQEIVNALQKYGAIEIYLA